jgi:hypothetical protein
MNLGHLVTATVALALVALPAAAQQRIEQRGTIAHAAAGAHFPERIGEFRRTSAYRYDRSGQDISASYVLDRGGRALVITVYVYPAARIGAAPDASSRESAEIARATLCDREFRNVQAAIVDNHRDAETVEEGEAPAADGIGPALARRSVHRFVAEFDEVEQPVRSEVDLYCFVGGAWLVKYRATSNADFDAGDDIRGFIRSGPWPNRNPPPAPDEVVARESGDVLPS